jgi:hypothetical protein
MVRNTGVEASEMLAGFVECAAIQTWQAEASS